MLSTNIFRYRVRQSRIAIYVCACKDANTQALRFARADHIGRVFDHYNLNVLCSRAYRVCGGKSMSCAVWEAPDPECTSFCVCSHGAVAEAEAAVQRERRGQEASAAQSSQRGKQISPTSPVQLPVRSLACSARRRTRDEFSLKSRARSMPSEKAPAHSCAAMELLQIPPGDRWFDTPCRHTHTHTPKRLSRYLCEDFPSIFSLTH